MDYKQAKATKKMWREEILSLLKEEVALELNLKKEQLIQLQEKQAFVVKRQTERAMLISIGNEFGADLSQWTITQKGFHSQTLAEIEESIKSFERCVILGEHQIKLLTIAIKVFSYAHNEDLGSVVKYYHQLKEQSAVSLELVEKHHDQIFSYETDLSKVADIRQAVTQKGERTEGEGAYLQIANGLKDRISKAEKVMGMLEQLEIAKEVTTAKKSMRKRKGKK